MAIKIFTSDTCAYCHQLKRWLESKGYKFEEINLSQNPERQQEAIDASGATTVPITIVEGHGVVVGLNIGSLVRLLSSGV